MIDEELVNLGEAMGGFEVIGLSFGCSFVCLCEGHLDSSGGGLMWMNVSNLGDLRVQG